MQPSIQGIHFIQTLISTDACFNLSQKGQKSTGKTYIAPVAAISFRRKQTLARKSNSLAWTLHTP